MEFIDISKEDSKKLFYLSKENQSFINLGSLAKHLSISRPMLFNYISRKYLIPKNLFIKLKKEANYNPRFKVVSRERYLFHKIKIPEIDEDLLEVIGSLHGDGHLSKDLSDVSITGGIGKDEDYLNYISEKLASLFQIKFKFSKNKNFVRIRFHSVMLGKFLAETGEMPPGNKQGQLSIPKIASSHKLLKSYIRGLFDTDGTIYVRRKKEPVIEISSADENYLKEVKFSLNSLGFNFGMGFHKIYLYRKIEIERFFEEIRPANAKHLKKYEMYFG